MQPPAETPPPDRAGHPLGHALPAQETWLRALLRGAGARGSALDDAVQETFARAWRSRDSFAAGMPLRPWLRRTALRAWIDLRARDSRQPQSPLDGLEPADATASATQHAIDQRIDLRTALGAALPPAERTVFERFHLQGMSIREIGSELGLPENTVKSHLHRGRRRLATALSTDAAQPKTSPEELTR